METETLAYSLSHHPARHRERVSIWAILWGVLGSGIAWAGHLMLNYAISVHACYPGRIPLSRPDSGAGWAWPVILVLDLITLGLIASSFRVAFRNFKLSGRESEGHHHHLMEVGEGRTRFLSLTGMAFAIIFFLSP
jgi:hypothetical protein